MDQLRILVVDDEPGIRKAVARALRDFSVEVPDLEGEVRFVVNEAETGEQAVACFDETPPHILLLDLKLPGISGIDVLDRVAAKHPDLLTIMITAYATIETAVRATKRGAYDFLAKPFTPAELENAVQKAAKHVVLSARARTLAEEKRQVRFQFISVLAHELKAPLNAIEGYLQVMKDRSAGEDIEVYAQMLDRCVTRTQYMRKMIIDLLDLTRIESGQKKRELSDVDVVDVARISLDTAAPAARERHVTVELHYEQPIPMHADPGELEIVFNNLVSNAIKYNRTGGRVDVYLDKKGDQVVVRVADTGIGMAAEEVSKLFNNFVRIKNKNTRSILGSGLGLSIVKKIANLYGGDATVASEPEVGSTFTVVMKDAVPAELEPVSAETVH